MIELFQDPTFRTVFVGTTAIGAVSGSLGCFAYLRKQSLIGDVVSHSSLFGIMSFFLISYLVTGEGSKSLFVLIPGAIFAGVLSLLLTRMIVDNSNVRKDSGLGVMLSIFFGTGVLMLGWVQKASVVIPGRRGLKDYLFGMAASMTQSDLVMIGILGLFSILVMVVFWKEFKVFTFDPLFSHSLGFKTKTLDLLLIVILVNSVVIGIQCVGVILMIALLITPAAAARQWTRSLGSMVTLAAVIGAVCGGLGSFISATYGNLPTGPIIVLTGIGFFIVSLLFAPNRGLISRTAKRSEAGIS
jgi:manganese/zinc/iron transport system permease protein